MVDIEEICEAALNEHMRKREAFGDEIAKIKTEVLNYIENYFTKLEASLVKQADEVDCNMENYVMDLKKLISKKKELDQFLLKLRSVVN